MQISILEILKFLETEIVSQKKGVKDLQEIISHIRSKAHLKTGEKMDIVKHLGLNNLKGMKKKGNL